MASTADIAQALKYGPRAGQQMRRSAYLEDALKALSAPQQNISSPGELAARLAGVAILSRASNKAQDRTLQAIADDRKSEVARLLAGIGPKAPPAPPQPPMPPVPPQAAPAPMVSAPAPMQQPAVAEAPQQAAPQGQGFQVGERDRDSLIRMLATEAIGEGPEGMAAAGHVALNRLKTGHGGAKSLSDVVYAKNQFEGMSRANEVRPDQYAKAAEVADAILSGRMGDPTGGAVNFINPELQLSIPGRTIPEWARGPGQRIGRHVFFGGNGAPAPQQMAQAPQAPQELMPPMPAPTLQTASAPEQQQAPQGEMQPFQVATAGSLTPDMFPSAPASSPPPSGAPPAATPQAAAGGNAPQWPNYMPTEAERQLVAQLLEDPRTFEQGRAEAMKLQQKMAQPAPAKIVEMNGVQFYVPETPGQGGPPLMIPIPGQAMTRNAPAEQFGVAAPRGTIMSADPYNNLKDVVRPEAGQQVASNPGEPYRETFVPGGKNDPYKVQAPGPGYRYESGPQGLQQAPIQGSPADLKAPANVMEGANRFGGMVKTIVDSAMKVKQNYGAVQTGFRQKNGPGDIAMTNGIQKLIDEGVVKGEDVNMQMQSNGLQGTLGGWQQYAASGGLFTDDVRQKIYKTATDLYKNLDRTYQVRIQSLQPGFDEAYGQGTFGKYVFPEAFAAELGWTGEKPGAGGPDAAPQPSPVQIRALQAVKGYDRSKPLGDPAHPFVAVDEATARSLDKPENRGKHIVMPDGSIGVID